MAESKKKGRGRPSEFKEEYLEDAYNYALLGASNERMADIFEVGITTFERWLKAHPQLRGALKKGRVDASVDVARSLYKRAMGYTCTEITVEDGKGEVTEQTIINEDGEIDEELKKNCKVRITKKHIAGDVTAMIFYLKNKEPDVWREKKEVTATVHGNLNFSYVEQAGNDPIEG